MSEWIPNNEFEATKYGQLNKQLDGTKYFGTLDVAKMPPRSSIVKDPKDGNFGIIVDEHGQPIGKVDLGA